MKHTTFIRLCFFEMKDLIIQYANYERDVLNHSMLWECRYYTLMRFNNFLSNKIGKDYTVYDVELQHIHDFITHEKHTPITTWHKNWKYPWPSAIFNKMSSIRMFFKYVCSIWYKLKFNWEQIPIFKMPDKKREPMEKKDYEILRMAPIWYAENELEWIRDQLMIDIPWETWLRRAEIVRIKFDDFHKENRQFQVLVKGWRYESVFFSEALRKRVLDFEKRLKDKYPFTIWTYVISHQRIRDRGIAFTPERASMTCRKYVQILKEKWLLNKDITLHQARHSFAMRCVYSGISQQATMQLMRHKDPKSTLHYYHLNETRLQQQYDRIKS